MSLPTCNVTVDNLAGVGHALLASAHQLTPHKDGTWLSIARSILHELAIWLTLNFLFTQLLLDVRRWPITLVVHCDLLLSFKGARDGLLILTLHAKLGTSTLIIDLLCLIDGAAKDKTPTISLSAEALDFLLNRLLHVMGVLGLSLLSICG